MGSNRGPEYDKDTDWLGAMGLGTLRFGRWYGPLGLVPSALTPLSLAAPRSVLDGHALGRHTQHRNN